MKSFWMATNFVLRRSDIILLVLDARYPEMSRHPELEEKALRKEKPIIYVLNKCDLADYEELKKWKKLLPHCVFISSKEKLGTTILKKKILSLARKEKVTVGVVGYPNTGKSSLINALKGKKSASTSASSGHTKGRQLIRISEKIYLLDSPGVLPFREDDHVKHALIGAVDANKVKDPELVVMSLLEEKMSMICSFYEVEEGEVDDVIEAIALKFKKLKKGGIADMKSASTMILQDWQRGKIRVRP